MPERRAVAVLDTHLWSLRAEVEAQLRTLTDIHRQIHYLPPRGDQAWSSRLDRITTDLTHIADANRIIGDLCDAAVSEVRALEGGQAGPRTA